MLDDALMRAAAVCTVTSEQGDKVAALFPKANVRVIANGIDFELWQATEGDHARARSWRDTHANGRRVLGCFGHLKAKKGLPFFVDMLRRSGVADRFHLLLIGETDELPLDGLSVTRLPPADRFDLIPFYLAADFVVLPSHYDGFPNVLIEAAALARPPLASSVGGMRDLVVDGESALLFEPGDEHGCRRAIVRAASLSDESLTLLGRRAERAAREHCEARDETRAYLDVLHHTARRIACTERFSS
jgi:glycosyltransferase involved in cell wall biosynthesis